MLPDAYVTPTFVGFIESPTAVDCGTTRLNISGWVFCRETPIKALHLQIDDAVPLTIPYGIPRADVAAVHARPSQPEIRFRDSSSCSGSALLRRSH